MRINVGCGQTPTSGWQNYDNSPSLYLARIPLLTNLFSRAGLLLKAQREFIDYARAHEIYWADVTKHIPLPDNAVEVVYTSHMVEHLDRAEVERFLREARRVLMPNGVLRIAVPDIKMLVDSYIASGDADAFVKGTHMAVPKPKGVAQKLSYALVGGRHHHWMYDANSLIQLLNANGFYDAKSLSAGETTIPEPGSLNLYERQEASLYVEAKKLVAS